jgi:hypothetical protein
VADSSPGRYLFNSSSFATVVCILEIGAFVVCAGEAPFATEFNGAPTAYHIYDWVAHAQD